MTRFALAVDIGGTKMEAALVSELGDLVAGSRARAATGRAATHASLTDATSQVVTEALAALPADTDILGIGIGSAGPVDVEAGQINPVNMPEAMGFPIVETARTVAEEILGHPVTIVFGHDGGALALAESWLGAVRDARSSLSIVVSTGIGGGFVLDGRRVRGATGNAGHLGQVRRDGEVLEALASGPGSVRWAQEQGWSGHTGEDLARDSAAGDAIARAAIERSATLVGEALADAATLLDLDVIAIGGGFSRVAEDYIDLVQQALTASAYHPYSQRTRVVRSGLGDAGPLIGAAAFVLR